MLSFVAVIIMIILEVMHLGTELHAKVVHVDYFLWTSVCISWLCVYLYFCFKERLSVYFCVSLTEYLCVLLLIALAKSEKVLSFCRKTMKVN